VFGELRALPAARVEELVEGIGPALDAVFTESEEREITPLAAARRVAAARLDRSREPAPAKMSA
jgi:hypothetical protein